MRPVDYRKNAAPKRKEPTMFEIVQVVNRLAWVDAILNVLVGKYASSRVVMRSINKAEHKGYIKHLEKAGHYEVTAKGMEFYTKEHI